MEQKVFLCLDCHAIFYDGVNHTCNKIHKSHFLSKLGEVSKHGEGIYGLIPHVFQYNGIGQVESLNYPAAFSSSTYDGIHFHAEYLQNISNGSNAYMKAQQEEHPDIPVMNISRENAFELSFHPSHQVSFRGNDENSLAFTSDTRQEITNYSTVPGVSEPAHDLQNDSSESRITKSMVHNYMRTPILYEQEGLHGTIYSGRTSSAEYCATTGVNNLDLLFSTDSCKPASHEGMDERNNLPSTNILEANCISKNFDFDLVQRDEDKIEAPHLQRLPQVISETRDTVGNKLADNDQPLVSESDELHIAGPSHIKVEDYCKYQDGRFICRLCEKSYTTKRNLTFHYRNHTGERPFACEKCPKTFTTKSYLTSHLRIHSVDRPFPCEMCEKRFFKEIDLNNHQLIHSVERPYDCNKCPKRFTQKWHLTVHLRTHTGEKPFPCDMCNKRFAKKHHLGRHRQTHIRD